MLDICAIGNNHPGRIFLIVVFVCRIEDCEDHTEEILCSLFAFLLVLHEGGLWIVPPLNVEIWLNFKEKYRDV